MAGSSPTSGPAPGLPVFPGFRPLALADRRVIQDRLWAYQPETSELTFTNLFIWQGACGYQWCLDRDWLLVAGNSPERGAFALPPVGPAPRREVCARLLAWLAEEKQAASPAIERADRRLAEELAASPAFTAEPVREHFDYLYRTTDLIHLAGGKYHAKRNQINAVTRHYSCRYEDLTAWHLPACRELAAAWCRIKRCEDDLNLMGEWGAVAAALNHLEALALRGGVILVNGKVEAFSLGELLNRETAVVHVEKANPEIPGLYALINQQFCGHALVGVPFVNREQDLGEPGLRAAKLSYQPHRLVEKFRIRLA